MEDVQRFLRYVMPGFMFFLEISLLLLCLFPQEVFCVIKNVFQNGDIDLGTPLTVLITSGGIGYLFSVIHHMFSSGNFCFFTRYGINHYDVLNKAIVWEHLSLRDYGRDGTITIPATALTQRGVWRIFGSLWRRSKLISENAIQHQERLSSHMHGAGASFIGSIVAFIAFLLWVPIHLILFKAPDVFGLLRGLFLSVIFISILWLDYRRVLEHTQGFVEISLANELDKYHWEHNRRESMKIFVFNRDLSEISEKLQHLPKGLEFPNSLKNRIKYSTIKKRLIFKGVMTESEKDTLIKLSPDETYRKVVERLYQKYHEVKG